VAVGIRCAVNVPAALMSGVTPIAKAELVSVSYSFFRSMSSFDSTYIYLREQN
jgi:hypothetical protein